MNKRTLQDIYDDAKKCPVKGRLYIYEQFKQELLQLSLDPYEYTEACRTLANLLEV